MASSGAPFAPDLQLFRRTLGHYASGITVIAGMVMGRPVGFTCQSFYSVSLEPPLVSFSAMSSSASWPKIRETGAFSVSILSARQREISNAFARSGTDKWAGVDWGRSASGNPIITGSLAWLDCDMFEEHPAGDHSIVIGQVREMSPVNSDESHEPLIFFKGQYVGST
ncbi:flavin reductase family protein [Mesorhizobium sp. INR15]|uniref:flavin reductase family protein n=1 Tax=Mesorhizobium sp. INR15 TaxID=2654248 RepID=UPI0018C174B0|nr:flavin reductase family protein [Mesorhizobium sp. INR15]QPC95335.1 flavin reductase [Mesorhizobium sp. INR15]